MHLYSLLHRSFRRLDRACFSKQTSSILTLLLINAIGCAPDEAPEICVDQDQCSEILLTIPADPQRTYTIQTWLSSDIITIGTADLNYTIGDSSSLSSVTSKQLYRMNPKLSRMRLRAKAEQYLRSRQNGRHDQIGWLTNLGTYIKPANTPKAFQTPTAQGAACSPGPNQCTEPNTICIIAEGQSQGTCENSLLIKFRDFSTVDSFAEVPATIRAVGQNIAIAVDNADTNAVSNADISELVRRFDQRIAPVNHRLFGPPLNNEGLDRDGNGIVLVFITTRVSTQPLLTGLVGFFQSDDLDGSQPYSNQADILYVAPPSASITLDQLSGTIAHEYQHLINYTWKVIRQQSSPEEVWLDEGLATFAEDATGYGVDAFVNIDEFLRVISNTSLTGAGIALSNDNPDTLQRRGMAHLLLRYMFEQAGGADYSQTPEVISGPGLAAISSLVQSLDTGVDLFTPEFTGRSLHQWLGDLFSAISRNQSVGGLSSCEHWTANIGSSIIVDDQNIENIPCRRLSFDTQVIDQFTGLRRGVNISPPPLASLDGNENGPINFNGGDIRTIRGTSATQTLRILFDAQAIENSSVGVRVSLSSNTP